MNEEILIMKLGNYKISNEGITCYKCRVVQDVLQTGCSPGDACHVHNIELKKSYYEQAILNLKEAERLSKAPKQITFDDFVEKQQKPYTLRQKI